MQWFDPRKFFICGSSIVWRTVPATPGDNDIFLASFDNDSRATRMSRLHQRILCAKTGRFEYSRGKCILVPALIPFTASSRTILITSAVDASSKISVRRFSFSSSGWWGSIGWRCWSRSTRIEGESLGGPGHLTQAEPEIDFPFVFLFGIFWAFLNSSLNTLSIVLSEGW